MLNREVEPQKEDIARAAQGRVVLLIGLPAAGKTTYAERELAPRGVGVLSADAAITAAGATCRVSADALRPSVEQAQVERARALAVAGHTVALDHGFWSAAEREDWLGWGRETGVPIEGVWLDAPAELRWERLQGRSAAFTTTDRAEFDAWTAAFEAPPDQEIEGYIAFTT